MTWKWVIAAAAIPFAAAAIAAGVGALLPRDHVARAARTMPAQPDRVAALVREVESYPRWRRALDRIEGVERAGGQTRFTERGGSDAIAFALVEEAPGRRFRSAITDPGLPFGGYWLIVIDPAGEGTRIAIEEHGFVTNPIFRFVSTLILGHERTMRLYLDDMERALMGRTLSAAPGGPSA
jgi:hypothetical protein